MCLIFRWTAAFDYCYDDDDDDDDDGSDDVVMMRVVMILTLWMLRAELVLKMEWQSGQG